MYKIASVANSAPCEQSITCSDLNLSAAITDKADYHSDKKQVLLFSPLCGGFNFIKVM